MKKYFVYRMSSLDIEKRLITLMLGLLLLFSVTTRTTAQEQPPEIELQPRSGQVLLYEGINLSTGFTQIDPTVLSLIFGDVQDITRIAAPAIRPVFTFNDLVDLYFGLSADPERPIQLVSHTLKGLAVVEEFTPALFDDIELIPDPPATAISSADLVALVTADDTHILLGNVVVQPDLIVRFQYVIVEEPGGPVPTPTPTPSEPPAIPEPATLLLLGVGIVGLIGFMKRQHINRSRKGGTRMKQFNIVLLAVVLVSLFGGTATAAELRVIRAGTGDGFVKGEDIWCGNQCRAIYEEGTLVQLKAKPDPDSRFVGWTVNEQPHEGALRIEGDMLVKAIFESIIPPDEMTVIWYAGDTKGRSTAARNEMIVYFDINAYEQQFQFFSKAYFEMVMEIGKQVHPDVEFLEALPDHMLLRWPEELTREELIERIMAVRTMEFVWWSDVVFYSGPEHPENESPKLPSRYGIVGVEFPSHYTEEEIQRIETEYGLERVLVERDWVGPEGSTHSILYRAGDHALEGIDIARRLYESGLVDSATPNLPRCCSWAWGSRESLVS